MEEWKTIFNVNLTSAQADQPLLVEPLLIEKIQMNNTMVTICSKMQILTQMFIKNWKKMLTDVIYGREYVRSGSCCRHSPKLVLPSLETYKTQNSRGQRRERLGTC